MFSRRKEKVDITSTDPQFIVRYIGKCETFTPNGKGCTKEPVQKIWDHAVDEKRLKRVSLLITPSGIIMTDQDGKIVLNKFDIKYISYCCAEQGIHDRTFAWVYKDSKKLECHAIQASSREKAQAMAVLLSRAFQIAYRDWKGHRDKAARQKNAHIGWQPPTSLKRVDSATTQPTQPGDDTRQVECADGKQSNGQDTACFSENGVIMDTDSRAAWLTNEQVCAYLQGEPV